MRISDWSSDVCSSDLTAGRSDAGPVRRRFGAGEGRCRGGREAREALGHARPAEPEVREGYGAHRRAAAPPGRFHGRQDRFQPDPRAGGIQGIAPIRRGHRLVTAETRNYPLCCAYPFRFAPGNGDSTMASPLPATRRMLSASDYGIVGDGIADDTAALQAALDEIGRAHV